MWNKKSVGSTAGHIPDLGDKTLHGCGWAERVATSLWLQPGNCTQSGARAPMVWGFVLVVVFVFPH